MTMFFILFLVTILALPVRGQTVEATEATPTFSSGVSDVRIDVQVTQDNELVTDLRKEDFVVFDEKARQQLAYFGRDSEPLSLLLLLDVSGSTKKYLEQIAATARTSLRFLKPKDKVAIMVFARHARLRLPWTDDMTEVADQLKQDMSEHSLGAGTNINDALLEAAKYIGESDQARSGRRAVLILTDNLGLNYKSPDAPVVDSLNDADTVLNAIVVGKGKRPEPANGNTYRNPDFTPPDVFRLSESTGGEAVQADKAGQAFARMLERIRTRYSLHYSKPASAAAGYRKVEVQLSPEARMRYPRAVLLHRGGYKVN